MQSYFDLSLFGPLRLIGPDGGDRTPRGAKVQGMLAILTIARGRPMARATLQDKLWSDRDQVRGRDSLKKALSELRGCFGAEAPAVLRCEGQTVRLCMDRLRVDVFETGGTSPKSTLDRPMLLDGITIRDPEFEDWLREMRAAFDVEQTPQPVPDLWAGTQPTRLSLGIQTAVHVEKDTQARSMANLVLDRTAGALAISQHLEVHDFRDLVADGPRAIDAHLTLRAVTVGGTLRLGFILARVADGRILLNREEVLDLSENFSEDIDVLVSESSDQILHTLFQRDALGELGARLAARQAIDGIDRMLRLAPTDLLAAKTALTNAIEADPKSSYMGWLAYLSAFQLEETKGSKGSALREEADALAARALELDPYSPLTRALLTHVYSFVFRDFTRSAALIEPVEQRHCDLAIVHHSLASLRTYTGDLDKARESAYHCRRIGRLNPYSYAFSTAVCMVEAARGEAAAAIRYGEEGLAVQINARRLFEPTLRYLALAYSESGDRSNGDRIWDCMRAQSPKFSVHSLEDESFPIPSNSIRERMRRAFSELGTA